MSQENFRQDFEQAVKTAAEQAVLHFVKSGGWLLPNYESRFKIPAAWIQSCWELVDQNELRRKIAANLESELADRMINLMAAELATDVKQILSDKERRERLRGLARDHMDAIMQGADKDKQ